MSNRSYYRPSRAANRARWSIWAALVGLIMLVAWASVAKIDQVTRAKGSVIASARTQEIQAADGGVLTQLSVKEGDQVKKGQLLVTLETARAQAAVDDSASKVAALKITIARLEAEVYNKPLRFDGQLHQYLEYIQNQTALYERRRQAIEQDVNSLQSMLKLAKQELALNEPLLKYGDVAQADVIKLRRQVADIQAQISNKQNKYFQDAQTELTKAQEDLSTESEKLRDRTQVLTEKKLFAPTDGLIKNIDITTIGGVVKAGETIMEILPTSSDLIVEAKVSPTDIAYVQDGQEAKVKLDAYDYSIFGAMKGKVFYISPDTLIEKTAKGDLPYYRVQIRIASDQVQGRTKEIVIKPGMTASIDIKAMQRTVYLT